MSLMTTGRVPWTFLLFLYQPIQLTPFDLSASYMLRTLIFVLKPIVNLSTLKIIINTTICFKFGYMYNSFRMNG